MVPPANQGRWSFPKRRAAGQKGPDAGGVPEHLVEGEGHVVRVPPAEDPADSWARMRRRPGERPTPAPGPGSIHSRGCWTPEKLDWAGKAKSLFRLSGALVRKASRVSSETLRSGGSTGTYRVEARLDPIKGPDPHDRVVVVKGEKELVPLLKGIRLPHQLQGPAGVGGEDEDILLRVGVEELQDPFRQRATRSVARADVGLVEWGFPRTEPVRNSMCFSDLGIPEKPPAGVVHVGVTQVIQPRELLLPEFINRSRG